MELDEELKKQRWKALRNTLTNLLFPITLIYILLPPASYGSEEFSRKFYYQRQFERIHQKYKLPEFMQVAADGELRMVKGQLQPSAIDFTVIKIEAIGTNSCYLHSTKYHLLKLEKITSENDGSITCIAVVSWAQQPDLSLGKVWGNGVAKKIQFRCVPNNLPEKENPAGLGWRLNSLKWFADEEVGGIWNEVTTPLVKLPSIPNSSLQ